MSIKNVSDSVSVSESISTSTESDYLLQSSKAKVTKMLVHSQLDQDNLIDIFINLHIILEVGINTLFRHLITPMLKKDVDTHKMVENLDKINFIDKVTMFVYYSKFEFTDIAKATQYHAIIGELKEFSEMRNKLLHVHAISSRFEDGRNSHSSLKKNLNLAKLQKQIMSFRFITEGLSYYLDCLSSGLTNSSKEDYKKAYLSSDFLTHTSFSSE